MLLQAEEGNEKSVPPSPSVARPALKLLKVQRWVGFGPTSEDQKGCNSTTRCFLKSSVMKVKKKYAI